jgi:hypothetical protein
VTNYGEKCSGASTTCTFTLCSAVAQASCNTTKVTYQTAANYASSTDANKIFPCVWTVGGACAERKCGDAVL